MAGTKRKHDEDNDKVYSNSSRNRPSVETKIDPTYGQRSAIPLDEDGNYDEADGDLNYDEEMDALAYLRSVRREANGIPNLLVAPKTPPPSDSRAIYENGVGDYRSRYEDGAFYAASEYDEDEEEYPFEEAPRTMYFNSILTQFQTLRDQLHQIPPPEAILALDASQPTCMAHVNASLIKMWRWKMRTLDPVPAQIASMDKDTVLRLLSVLSGGPLFKRGCDVEIGVSRWTWSLLARLPERGELNSEEIGIVRELGKKAVLVGVGLVAKQSWEEGMQEVEAGYEDEDDAQDPTNNKDGIPFENEDMPDADMKPQEDSKAPAVIIGPIQPEQAAQNTGTTAEEDSLEGEDFLAAKAKMLSAIVGEPLKSNIEPEFNKEQTPESMLDDEREYLRMNTKATIDMIITVAGEVYGQRDLLEFRDQWSDL